jgi:hypothetical protein
MQYRVQSADKLWKIEGKFYLEEWWIHIQSICGTNKILRKEFEDGYVHLELLSSEEDDFDPYAVVIEEQENKLKQKKHGELIKRDCKKFSDSVYVRLIKGYPPKYTVDVDGVKWMDSMPILIRRDRFLPICKSLVAYRKGTTTSSGEEGYKNLYLVYEQFSEKRDRDQELKAICVSLSHSLKDLTDQKTIDTLKQLFGDTKIDFDNHKHAVAFSEKYNQLRYESEKLLIKEILKILPSSPNFLGKYYRP